MHVKAKAAVLKLLRTEILIVAKRLCTALCLVCAASLLAGCNSVPSLAFPGVYRIDIPQGNIITQEMIDQLRPGLTKRQVTFILGTPLIRDTFDQDRWDYLYSYQPGGGERVQERIAVFFDDNGELTHFEGDFEQTPENMQFPAQAQTPTTAPTP
jgi:outer membrane protein assembly factor BamE (lipoprotein component of BamABCDE complex)